MINDNTCELLESDANSVIAHHNWEATVRENISLLCDLHDNNRNELEKEWQFRVYYNSSRDAVEDFVEQLINNCRKHPSYEYFTSFHNGINQTGMYSMCLRYNVFGNHLNPWVLAFHMQNKGQYYKEKYLLSNKLACLLSNTGFYSQSKEKVRYSSAVNAVTQLSSHISIQAWNRDLKYYTQRLPIFSYQSYGINSYVGIFKFWWLLTNNAKVSEYCFNLLLKENDWTIKTFASKMKRYNKCHKFLSSKVIDISGFNDTPSPITQVEIDMATERLKHLGVII